MEPRDAVASYNCVNDFLSTLFPMASGGRSSTDSIRVCLKKLAWHVNHYSLYSYCASRKEVGEVLGLGGESPPGVIGLGSE